MDWDDLRIFLAVARSESLSGAGKRLALDPATVGRRIARLEERSATLLFNKSPQGYVLTEDGLRLLPHAEATEAATAGAAESLSRFEGAGGITGQIRLGAPDGCANYLLPPVISEISAANPGLEVQLVALPRVFNLSKREADMAIGVSRPQAGRLTVQKLTDYRLSLAAHPDYLAKSAPITSCDDLQGHRIVGYIPDMIFDKELDYLGELGLTHVDVASNSVPVQLQLLRAGAGLGVVHDFALPQAPELSRVLRDKVRLTRAFWLIRHEGDARSVRLSRFADALAMGIRREVQRLEAFS